MSASADSLGCADLQGLGADFEYAWLGGIFKDAGTGTWDTIHVWVEVSGGPVDMRVAIYRDAGNDGSYDTLVFVDSGVTTSLSNGSSWRKWVLTDGTQQKVADDAYVIFGYADQVALAACDGDLAISCDGDCPDNATSCPWAYANKGNFTTDWIDTIFSIGTTNLRQVRIVATYYSAAAGGQVIIINTD
jgi:hypothetical protein